MPPSPLCPPSPCALGASLLILLAGSSFSAGIPCDPAVPGAQVSVQGARVLAPGGCDASACGAAFAASDAIDTTIG